MRSSSLRNPERRPSHPGAVLREDVLPALGMTQTRLARRLGVSRYTVGRLLREERALSPEMAARLAKLLGTSPEPWLNMQGRWSFGKSGNIRRGWPALSRSGNVDEYSPERTD